MKKLLAFILTSLTVLFLPPAVLKMIMVPTPIQEEDGTTYTVIIKIENNTGTLTFEEKGEDGQTQSEEQGLTVDQERKRENANSRK